MRRSHINADGQEQSSQEKLEAEHEEQGKPAISEQQLQELYNFDSTN